MSTSIDTQHDLAGTTQNTKKSGAQARTDTSAAGLFASLLKKNQGVASSLSNLTSSLSLPQRAPRTEENFARPAEPQVPEEPRAEEPGDMQDQPPEAAYVESALRTQDSHAGRDVPNHSKPDRNTPDAPAASGQANDTSASDKAARQAAQAGPQQQAGKTAKGAPEASLDPNAAAKVKPEVTTAQKTPQQPQTEQPVQQNQQSRPGDQNTAIKASVSQQSAQLTSKPGSSLASNSTVSAVLNGEEGATAKALKAANNTNGQQAGNQNQNGNNAANANAQAKLVAAANSAVRQTAQQPVQANGFSNAMSAAVNAAGKSAPVQNVPGSSGMTTLADPLTGGTGVAGQNGSLQRPTTASTAQAQSTRPSVPPKVIADQVAVNIQRAAGQGADKISLQLRPQELGRIDVKMEMASDGRMTATISAERPETLDALRSDARALVQSLNDAGLQTDSSSLSFNLKGQEGNGQQTASGNGKAGPSGDTGSEDGMETADGSEELLATGQTATPDDDGRWDVRV